MGISYEACLDFPEIWGYGGATSCIDINQNTFSDGTRQCRYGSTPVLTSVGVKLYSQGFGDFDVNLGMWIGVNPDTECVWVGSEEAGVCASGCYDDVSSPDEFVSLVERFLDELEGAANDIPDWVFTTAATGVLALLVAGAIFYLLSGGGLAVAAGAAIVAGSSAG